MIRALCDCADTGVAAVLKRGGVLQRGTAVLKRAASVLK